MSVIVDTCVWSRFLRHDRDKQDPVVCELERLVRADEVQMLGPIRQELLSGAQPQERFGQLKDYLRFFPNLSLNEEDDETAAEFYNRCRAHGIQGAPTDFIICATASRRRLAIFTVDEDFRNYAKYLPITLHRYH